jgi:hypothetical protein
MYCGRRSNVVLRATLSRNKKNRQLVRDLQELLQIADERAYLEAIKKRFPEINEASPRFAAVLEIWREQHGGGRHRR